MTTLHLDLESRSALDLTVSGLDLYVNHPSTELLMEAWAIDDNPVQIWEPHISPKQPLELREALEDPAITKISWNASFEREFHKWVLDQDIPIRFWKDSMVMARYMALPGSLDECGNVLNISKEFRKMDNSNRLKDMFCLPVKEGGEETLFGISEPVFRDWNSNPVDWELFKKYCMQDVVAERAIKNRLKNFPLPDHEWEAWYLDQEINERGIAVDMELVKGGSYIADIVKAELLDKLQKLTGLDNPNSRDQLLGFLREHNYPFHELGKAFVSRALIEKSDMDGLAREILLLRQQSAKTSAQKLINIAGQVSNDGRLRHQFGFYGARTGRWTSGGQE